MDRNLLLAFVLSFLVLYSWSAFVQPPPDTPPGSEAEAGATAGDERDPGSSPGLEPAASAPDATRFSDLPSGPGVTPAPARDLAGDPVPAAAPSAPGESIVIDRRLYTAVLNTRGGVLESWKLKEYTDEYGDPVALVSDSELPDGVAKTPFSELNQGDLSHQSWRVASQDANEIVFAWERDGVLLHKTWRFDDDDYTFRLRLDVENGSSEVLSPRFLVDWPAGARDGQDFADQAFALLHTGEVEQEPIAGLGSAGFFGFGGPAAPYTDYLNEIDWAGVQSTYFVSALLPDSPSQASARVSVIDRGKSGSVSVFFDAVGLPPGQTLTREFRGYVGPKEMERLEAVGAGIDRSVDLGWAWFAPLTRGFGWLLQALYTFIPNYGWAIIVLTILVRVVTAPLTVKQMRSMERLRRVQPLMKEIQEKHADDRQKQSEAMMQLYRTEKVNPLGGCFPMLLQLPVFIGLFYALRSSISLRQAPFFGWIDDLSAPEALFMIPGLELPVRVLPLIMGGTMFLQQKITPMQTPDPAQARMMLTIMPLMMTVLFYQFASGLVLYWLMSNVLAILHQLWIGRNMGPPGAAAAADSGSPKPKAA